MTNKKPGAQQARELSTIKTAVAFAFGLKESLLYSKTRKHEIVVPRMVAMWIARKLTLASYPDIAAAFGKKNHCTVMHAEHATNTRMALDETFAARVQNLRKIVETGLRDATLCKKAS